MNTCLIVICNKINQFTRMYYVIKFNKAAVKIMTISKQII